METIVVNLRLEKCDVKISRNSKGVIPNPPHPGCFGNPFYVEKYGREKCIELYREYFYKRIAEDNEFKLAIHSLKGKRLGCFCKQADKEVACHGDVIKEYLDSYV